MLMPHNLTAFGFTKERSNNSIKVVKHKDLSNLQNRTTSQLKTFLIIL